MASLCSNALVLVKFGIFVGHLHLEVEEGKERANKQSEEAEVLPGEVQIFCIFLDEVRLGDVVSGEVEGECAHEEVGTNEGALESGAQPAQFDGEEEGEECSEDAEQPEAPVGLPGRGQDHNAENDCTTEESSHNVQNEHHELDVSADERASSNSQTDRQNCEDNRTNHAVHKTEGEEERSETNHGEESDN